MNKITPQTSRTRRLLSKLIGQQRYREITQGLNSFKRLLRPKHEPEAAYLEKLVNPGDIAFEIGANYGQYSRVLSRLVGKAGQVHAFEPATVTYRMLTRNIRLLGLKNVKMHKIALSNQVGITELHTPIKREGVFAVAVASLSRHETLPTVCEHVAMDTLDHFAESNGISRIKLLRCDVEGAEFCVLQGGQRILTNSRPSILMEIHPAMLHRWGQTVPDIEHFLKDLAYEFFMLKDGQLVQLGHLPTTGQDYNAFCVPAETTAILMQTDK